MYKAMIQKGIADILQATEKNSLRLSEARTNLAANPGRSPLMRSLSYASAGDRPAFADMDVGVRATQEQLAEFARFPLEIVPFMQYASK